MIPKRISSITNHKTSIVRLKHEKAYRITNHNHSPLLLNVPPNPPGEDYTEDFDMAPLYAEWINNEPHNCLNDGHPMVFVHDLMGSHKNVKILAQKLTRQQNQSWGLLLDLTGHGQSVGRRLYKQVDLNFASYDLSSTTATQIQITGPNFHLLTIMAIGYGGRIALRYASYFDFFPRPTHLWLVDTLPTPPDESTWKIVHAVENVLKDPNHSIRDRNHLVEILQTPTYGIDKTMALFLSAQYEKYYQDFIFDIRHVQTLLQDMAQQDFWAELTTALEHGIMVDLVQSEKKDHLSWIESAPKLAKLRSRFPINFRYHVLNKSGRWLHVAEDLGRLLALVRRRRMQQDFAPISMYMNDNEVYLDQEEEFVENPPPLRLKKKKKKLKRKPIEDKLDFDFVDQLETP
jgi:pimeloyl-ACP methyl ester carboxylesterase